MLTLREAIQRLQQYRMTIRRFGCEWLICFAEDKRVSDDNSYVTDDLEDAVDMAARMRLRRLQAAC